MTHERFPKLFFISCAKSLGGKHPSLIKFLGKQVGSFMLSVYYVQLVGGVRAEKLVDWLHSSFLTKMKPLNLLRYQLISCFSICMFESYMWLLCKAYRRISNRGTNYDANSFQGPDPFILHGNFVLLWLLCISVELLGCSGCEFPHCSCTFSPLHGLVL